MEDVSQCGAASSRLRIWPGCSKVEATVGEDDAGGPLRFLAAKPQNRLPPVSGLKNSKGLHLGHKTTE